MGLWCPAVSKNFSIKGSSTSSDENSPIKIIPLSQESEFLGCLNFGVFEFLDISFSDVLELSQAEAFPDEK